MAQWGLWDRNAPGGRWGRRFLTLTLPHSGEPKADALELVNAWGRFRRYLVTWIEREQLGRHCGEERARELRRAAFRYLRVLEITPGTSDDGNAHLHALLWSPYLPQSVLAFLWGRALSPTYRRRAPRRSVFLDLLEEPAGWRREQLRRTLRSRRGGTPRGDYARPVVDVRIASKGWESELVKYMVKDAAWVHDGGEKSLAYADPDAFGRLYAALDNRRCVVASRGLWVPRKPVECECCGEVDWSCATDQGATPESRRARAARARALEHDASQRPRVTDWSGWALFGSESDIPY